MVRFTQSFILACLLAAFISTGALRAQQGSARRPGGVPLDERFKMMDRNGDGVLTADEMPNPETFKAMDKDGDGKVTLEEARAFGMQGGTRPAEERFKKLDKNGDGALTADEVPNPQMIKRADKNGDGKVTLEEFKAFVMSQRGQGQRGPADNRPFREQMQQPHSPGSAVTNPGAQAADAQRRARQQQFAEAFQRADTNHDGKVSKEEALEWMKLRFDQVDADKDGFVTPEELRVMFQQVHQQREAQPQQPPAQ